jgi:hypothetical protein
MALVSEESEGKSMEKNVLSPHNKQYVLFSERAHVVWS